MLSAVAHQTHLDFIFGVYREGVTNCGPATQADGDIVGTVFLGKIRGQHDGIATGRRNGSSHCQAADFLGCRQVAFEQRRREIDYGHIIEAVTGFIGGQERRDIDFDAQEIADGVLVFRPGQPPDRTCSARVGLGCRGAVELLHQGRDNCLVGPVIGTGQTGGRHVLAAEFPDDLFPLLRVLSYAFRVNRVERQAAHFQLTVVTSEAVLIDDRGVNVRSRRLGVDH